MLAEAADANDMYEEALSNLKHRTPVSRGKAGPSNAEKEQAAKDYYAGVRTNVRCISRASTPYVLFTDAWNRRSSLHGCCRT